MLHCSHHWAMRLSWNDIRAVDVLLTKDENA